MSTRDRSRRRVLSADERVLWSKITRSIVPLHPAPLVVPVEEAAESVLPSPPAKRSRKAASAAAPPAVPPVSPLPPLAPLGRRMRARVARGRETIDARLDLHGLTQADAHAALTRFLRSGGARGARLVLVITGKGQRHDGESGVLRRQVPQWLRLPEFRAFVIGFEPAHNAHGGEGALYVRLRRPRGD